MAGWSHGTADFASTAELRKAGWLDGQGLVLGSVRDDSWLSGGKAHVLRFPEQHHHVIVAGSGGGKFVSGLGVMLFDLLNYPAGSCVVIDPKAEALEKIGKLAIPPFNKPEGDGYKIRWLDPWNESGTGASWSLNFLAALGKDERNMVDDAKELADAIIVPSGGSDRHWDDSARIMLRGLLLYVALHPSELRRDLVRVRDILGGGWDTLADIFGRMREFEGDTSGTIRRVGCEYVGENGEGGKPEKERESILSAARRDTAWLDSPQIQAVVRSTPENIDPLEVAAGREMVFVVLPPYRVQSHRSWLRLCITAFATAFKKAKPRNPALYSTRRHFFIDEFQSLGKLDSVAQDFATARGYGVQYHAFTQSFGQLKEHYGEAWQDLVANSVVQAFAVQDVFTSEYLSTSAGEKTIENKSSGVSWGEGWKRSTNSGSTEAGRRVMLPDEIRRMPWDAQLILPRGLNPVYAGKLNVERGAAFQRGQRFTLAELFDTIGRNPADADELAKFQWRD